MLVLLCQRSSRAGGLGLNLQAVGASWTPGGTRSAVSRNANGARAEADTVVLFDLDWNPQNDKQA